MLTNTDTQIRVLDLDRARWLLQATEMKFMRAVLRVDSLKDF